MHAKSVNDWTCNHAPLLVAVVLFAIVGGSLLPGTAVAATYTWSGSAPPGEPNWFGAAANWNGKAPPSEPTIRLVEEEGELSPKDLVFPELAGCVASAATCSNSHNNLGGQYAHSMSFGCGSYGISGASVTLGSGGLNMICPNATFVRETLFMPLEIKEEQTWTIEGQQESELTLEEPVTGPSAGLTVNTHGDSFLVLENRHLFGLPPNVEVGPVVIHGTHESGIADNGILNASDGNPVTVSGARFVGPGKVGTLTSLGGLISFDFLGRPLEVTGNLTLNASTDVLVDLAFGGNPIVVEGKATLESPKLSFLSDFEGCPTSGDKIVLLRALGEIKGNFSVGNTQIECHGETHLFQITYTQHEVTATDVSTPPPPPPEAPAITTAGASAVTSTSATLNGSVTPNGVSVRECYFDYGETSNVYGSKAPCVPSQVGGSTPVSVSAVVGNLTPGTTYHFRLVATSSAGTGYGSDETFTTSGSGAPTLALYGPFTYWYDSTGRAGGARFEGTINPHGSATGYIYYYGTQSIGVSSAADLSLYQNTLPVQVGIGPVTNLSTFGAGSGTTPVSTSQLVEGLQRDTKYYVRLAAVYPGGTVWSPEVPFEITPPEPEATEAPYLEANGGNANNGYDLRCQPGTWRYASGFEYNWYGGFSWKGDGAIYHVALGDAGHQIWCQVTPRRLDGSPAPSLALPSYVTIPQVPGGLILPSYLKDAFKTGNIIYTTASAGNVIMVCGAALFIPGLGEAVCGLEGLQFFVEGLFITELESATDPPDPHYTTVALPTPSTGPNPAHYSCPRRVTRRTCRGLSVLAAQDGAAADRAGSVVAAFAVSRNRTLIARRKKDSETQLTQQGARKVYAGLLATALQSQQQAGLAYANGLRRVHSDVRISTKTLRRIAKYPTSKILKRSVSKRLLATGFTRAAIQREIKRARIVRGSFDLQAFLRHPMHTAALIKYYDSMELNDVVELVMGLGRQHALKQNLIPHLLTDIDKARAACTQAGRASALGTLLTDAQPGAQRPYLAFLATAVQPLADGASTVDQYPHCLR